MRRKLQEEGKKCSNKLVMLKGAQYLKVIPESWWRKFQFKNKVNCTLGQSIKAQRESRTIALFSFTNKTNKCTSLKLYFYTQFVLTLTCVCLHTWDQMVSGWSQPHRGLLTSGKDPIPIIQEAEWDPGPVSAAVENFSHLRIQSLERILIVTKLKISGQLYHTKTVIGAQT